MDLRILTWNVGISKDGQRLSCKWNEFNNYVYFGNQNYTRDNKKKERPIPPSDIYCLQEFPQIKTGNMIGPNTLQEQHWEDNFHKVITNRGKYSIVTLVSKQIGDEQVDIDEPNNLGLRNYPFYFGHKMDIVIKNKKFQLFNLHLRAMRNDLLNSLKTNCDQCDKINKLTMGDTESVVCGDFNLPHFLLKKFIPSLRLEGDVETASTYNEPELMVCADPYEAENYDDALAEYQHEGQRLDYVGSIHSRTEESVFKQEVFSVGLDYQNNNEGVWRHFPVVGTCSNF